jgi:hypothetical protein
MRKPSKQKQTHAPCAEASNTITVVLPPSSKVTPELIIELDNLLDWTDGGRHLWDAHYALLYEFLDSNHKPRFLTKEYTDDSFFLGKFLSWLRWNIK